ncbi:MAG: hypothetical protein O6922_05095 [Chloroflexi bacterium]|nr:hypothetical protein [Chloroflexota bacterium]
MGTTVEVGPGAEVAVGARGGAAVAVGNGSTDGVEVGVDIGAEGVAIAASVLVTGVGCRVSGVTLAPVSPEPPEPNAPGVAVTVASLACSGILAVGIGVAVTITVT